MMSLYINSNWRSSNKDDMDTSGVATFKTADKEYTIPFNNFTDYYNLIDIIVENGKMAKIEAFKSVGAKLNILIQEIEHADY